MTMQPAKLDFLVGRMLDDMGAAAMMPLVRLGDELGLYRAMAGAGPLSSEQLAFRTGTHERYVREWLSAHAASGYVDYDAASECFTLTPEQAMIFANPDSPVFMLGGYQTIAANALAIDKIEQAFRTGEGVDYGERHACLFTGMERFFRPGYNAHLLEDWLPAMTGLTAKLTRGAKVADIGCGHGASTLMMAEAFPNSEFHGFDYHAPSIKAARVKAAEAGLANAYFTVASAKDFPGNGFDLIAYFDALHDMGDPVGAAAYAARALAEDGALMLVEPIAGDTLLDNLNPVGRLYYAASTMVCTPVSLAQEVGLGLGAQAGQQRLAEVLGEAGLSKVRRAATTDFNMVLEARK
ncbi:MAG: class I SAM-dependent methyltransferase [Sphingomonadaceae bacterium]|nr:class I SAM-dependent methyltransferase [Sphingomonadaceae bacterium]